MRPLQRDARQSVARVAEKPDVVRDVRVLEEGAGGNIERAVQIRGEAQFLRRFAAAEPLGDRKRGDRAARP